MARVNVYLPDDLAEAARAGGLNVSSITQEALRRALAARSTTTWLERLQALAPTGVSHQEAMAALDAVRTEAGDEWPPGTGGDANR